MPAGTIRRTIKHRRSRRKNLEAAAPQPVTPVLIVGVDQVGTVLTLHFDQVVSLTGLPAFTTDVAGATPLSATQPTPSSVAINFNGSIITATKVNIGYRDPAIRSASGGYVTGTTYTV